MCQYKLEYMDFADAVKYGFISTPEIERTIERMSEKYKEYCDRQPEDDRWGEVQPGGHPEFHRLLNEMRDTHIAKNAGYAGTDNPDPLANFRECEALGIPAFVGAWIRWMDKVARLRNILRNPLDEQCSESISDTLIDAANYALIVRILYEEHKESNNRFIELLREIREFQEREDESI